MVEQGGLLTEYSSTEEMSPHNFPERNRIIAGISDAVVVVESGAKGGAVITANIANSYNKDLFDLQGITSDKISVGCNFLIKTFKATMIESGKDLLEAMRWNETGEQSGNKKAVRQLSLNLSGNEALVFNLLNEKGEVEIDTLVSASGINSSSMAATLLEMEMSGLIVSLPGKRYKLI